MIKAFLLRLVNNDKETLGRFLVYGDQFKLLEGVTLELPWRNNQRVVSCIPKGSYQVRFCSDSEKIPYPHFEILNIPGRDGVKIHRGNFVENTKGCVLIGSDFGDINSDGVPDVTGSKVTLDQLLIIGRGGFELTVA